MLSGIKEWGIDEPNLYLLKTELISKDGKTYTVRLRKGLKWSDGKGITADDVVSVSDLSPEEILRVNKYTGKNESEESTDQSVLDQALLAGL